MGIPRVHMAVMCLVVAGDFFVTFTALYVTAIATQSESDTPLCVVSNLYIGRNTKCALK